MDEAFSHSESSLRLPDKPLGQVRLVLMDLDGTALDGDKLLTARLLRALHMLRSRHVLYTFVSARMPSMMGIYCAQANISGPVVALEGAEIWDWCNNRSLLRTSMAKEAAEALLHFCSREGLDYAIYTQRAVYLKRDTGCLSRFTAYNKLAASAGLEPVSCLFYEAYSAEMLAGEGILKVFAAGLDSNARRKMEKFLSGFPDLRACCSAKDSLSVTAKGASKGAAVQFLCGYLGLAPQEICCFGDYYNDLDMLRLVGNSVAMGNAPRPVRQAARYVTASNLQDGAAMFLERYAGCGQQGKEVK